ncbi:hypothetical protein EV213_1083 [Aureibacillus halotolerans]|uniref:Rhodanese domain-containing protein n=2 Tax=Aureibacillus halotolerans TaxID=1508390 RepID=A0A4V3D578_9BACI|nr:hypothetical protein EV213_1083 [Aureibacillus halotolerans]
MKQLAFECADQSKYYVIDVRDFISFNKAPSIVTKNIPLSYLPREMREEARCSKDIVVIADDLQTARSAVRIIKKRYKNKVFYSILPKASPCL